MRNAIAFVRRRTGVAFRHCRLHLRRASERINDTGELDEQPVAGGLDEAAAVLGDFRIEDFGAKHPEPSKRPFLVSLY